VKACVFVGPSLGSDAPASGDGLAVLPPAARGDLYRAALAGPQVIGLIDGYFDGVPAVAHKEILWALDQGIRVLGAASMGALRAAELAPFGMEGVGAIWRDYASGTLEGDDEVAVLHGPAESDWLSLSESLVNVRATLAAAEAAGVLDSAAAAAILQAARTMFYKERRWKVILAASEDAEPAVLAGLANWLPAGRVDRKREDARLLLERVQALLREQPSPPDETPPFEHTQIWDEIAGEIGDVAEDPLTALLVGEARLDPERYRPLLDRALARLAAGTLAAEPDAAEVRRRIERMRLEAGLLRRAELEAWLALREVDGSWLERQARDALAVEAMAAARRPLLERLCLDELRLSPAFPEALARAQHKEALLAEAAARGVRWPPPSALAALRQRQGESASAAEIAARLGFSTVEELYRVLLAEHLYTQSSA
jgi:hypothetical protein